MEQTEKTYSLTLNRWHKVAERLTMETDLLQERITNIYSSTRIGLATRFGVAERLYLLSEQAQENLEQLPTLWLSIGNIRKAIATANARIGVTARITEADILQRKIRFLRAILDEQSANMVPPDKLDTIKDAPVGSGGWASDIEVRMLDSVTHKRLAGDLTQAMRVRNALLDHVADLNKERVELSLPIEVAEIAGLTETV